MFSFLKKKEEKYIYNGALNFRVFYNFPLTLSILLYIKELNLLKELNPPYMDSQYYTLNLTNIPEGIYTGILKVFVGNIKYHPENLEFYQKASGHFQNIFRIEIKAGKVTNYTHKLQFDKKVVSIRSYIDRKEVVGSEVLIDAVNKNPQITKEEVGAIFLLKEGFYDVNIRYGKLSFNDKIEVKEDVCKFIAHLGKCQILKDTPSKSISFNDKWKNTFSTKKEDEFIYEPEISLHKLSYYEKSVTTESISFKGNTKIQGISPLNKDTFNYVNKPINVNIQILVNENPLQKAKVYIPIMTTIRPQLTNEKGCVNFNLYEGEYKIAIEYEGKTLYKDIIIARDKKDFIMNLDFCPSIESKVKTPLLNSLYTNQI